VKAILRAPAGALYDLTDEDKLRARICRLGERASGIGASTGQISLGRVAILSCEAVVAIVSVVLIGGKRTSRQISLLAKSAWQSSRDFAALILSRGFWEAGKADARIYARHISYHSARLGGRSITAANRLVSRLASFSGRT
jgi:hypothetical protein